MSEHEARPRARRRPRRSAEIKNLDGQIAERFRTVRKALFVPPQPSAQERKALQRERLARELGVSTAMIESVERREQPIGGAELLRMMQRFHLDPSYFLAPDAELPLAFMWEQRFQELNDRMESVARNSGRRSAEPRRSKRKGGWLKGLPRKAKTPKDEAIIEAWREARDQGVNITSIKALMDWKRTGEASNG